MEEHSQGGGVAVTRMIRRDEIESDDVDVNVTLKLIMDSQIALLEIDYLGVRLIPTAQAFKKMKPHREGIMLDQVTYYWDDIDDVKIRWPVI